MSNKTLHLADFQFEVPEEQIAQVPLDCRDASKFLIWRQNKISHSSIIDIDQAVPESALIIVNDSRVIASRIHGKLPSGGAVELLLLEPFAQTNNPSIEAWSCLGKPMRKFSAGLQVNFNDGLIGKILEKPTSNADGPTPIRVEFNLAGSDLLNWLQKNGEMPLPPYIARKNPNQEIQNLDKSRYQTIYAQGEGSVAAPTAGLHFSETMMKKLAAKNCKFATVTLHVGAGTFLPVKADNPVDHVMHSERFMVTRKTLQMIQEAQEEGRSIIVVGTTALRCLEGLDHIAKEHQSERIQLADKWHRTEIFIYPKTSSVRYKPWCANALMTNFHQPGSTLFMLVCSLVGFDNAHKIYREAVSNKYRFFSYGDSSLLWLNDL